MRVAAARIAMALLLAAGCAADDDGRESSRPEFSPITEPRVGFDPVTTLETLPPTSTTVVTSATSEDPPPTSPPATAPPVTNAPPPPAVDPFTQLVVAPEGNGAGYERELFQHWVDADGDGCHTRCEVLAAEQRTDLPGLTVGWYSIYDGQTTGDASDLDIDHVVALAEAWRSGADTWDAGRRRAFANDLDEPDALIAVTASTNRSKSDQDPSEWRPPERGSWCQWAGGWVRVKVKWGLTADQAEVDALRAVLSAC